MSTWDSLQLSRSPHSRCIQPPSVGLQALQISEARLRNPLLSAYPQGKEGKALEGPFLKFFQTLWAMLVPWALIHWNQQSREIRERCIKGCSWPFPALALIQICHQHKAKKSWSFYTDWSFTENRQLIHQKLYIIGNNLCRQRLVAGVRETLPPTLLKTEQCFFGWPRDSTLPIIPEASSGGRWRWYWECSRTLNEPHLGTSLMKSWQGKTGKTSQAWDNQRLDCLQLQTGWLY